MALFSRKIAIVSIVNTLTKASTLLVVWNGNRNYYSHDGTLLRSYQGCCWIVWYVKELFYVSHGVLSGNISTVVNYHGIQQSSPRERFVWKNLQIKKDVTFLSETSILAGAITTFNDAHNI